MKNAPDDHDQRHHQLHHHHHHRHHHHHHDIVKTMKMTKGFLPSSLEEALTDWRNTTPWDRRRRGHVAVLRIGATVALILRHNSLHRNYIVLQCKRTKNTLHQFWAHQSVSAYIYIYKLHSSPMLWCKFWENTTPWDCTIWCNRSSLPIHPTHEVFYKGEFWLTLCKPGFGRNLFFWFSEV